MPRIRYLIGDQTYQVEGEVGDNLLQIALDHHVPIEHACGGNGFCTTCLCNVKAGAEHLNPRNDREEMMGITDDPERLGCQAIVESEGEVEVELLM